MKRTESIRYYRNLSSNEKNKLKMLYFKNRRFRQYMQDSNPNLCVLISPGGQDPIYFGGKSGSIELEPMENPIGNPFLNYYNVFSSISPVGSTYDFYFKMEFFDFGGSTDATNSLPNDDGLTNGFFSIFLTDTPVLSNFTLLPSGNTGSGYSMTPNAVTNYLNTLDNKFGVCLSNQISATAQAYYLGLKSGITNGLTTPNAYPTYPTAGTITGNIDVGTTFYTRFTNTGSKVSILMYNSSGVLVNTIFANQSLVWTNPQYLIIINRYSPNHDTLFGTVPLAYYNSTKTKFSLLTTNQFESEVFSYNVLNRLTPSAGSSVYSMTNSFSRMQAYRLPVDMTVGTTSIFIYKMYMAAAYAECGVILKIGAFGTGGPLYTYSGGGCYNFYILNAQKIVTIGSAGRINGTLFTSFATVGDWVYWTISVQKTSSTSVNCNISLFNNRTQVTNNALVNYSVTTTQLNVLLCCNGASAVHFIRVPSLDY